jgi:hypothetical protein|tara:strand:- start:300 stop:698 length:399 start_codon:yes stop_codon:yes gene_type:complete
VKRIGIAIALVALVLLGVQRISSERKLTGDEIRETRAGHSFRFEADTGSTGVISYKADGTMTGRKVSGAADTGRWWVEGDRYCQHWRNWRHEERHCYHIYEIGEKQYRAAGIPGKSAAKGWKSVNSRSWLIE